MFTGIIKEIGVVAAAERSAGGVRLTVRAPKCAPLLAVDDSVAVSGVCQTVIARSGETFTVQLACWRRLRVHLDFMGDRIFLDTVIAMAQNRF